MALVNPNIAMSFRMPEFTPRNALADYAAVQQIQSGQRQAEVADMQLEALRRDRDALSQIQAAIVAKGGPPDLLAASEAMIKTGKPEYIAQGQLIRDKFLQQKAFADYQKDFMPNALAPTGMPTGAPAMAPAPEPGSFAADVASRRAAMPGGAAAPVNALAPTAAPAAPANAMAAQPDVASLEARYRRVASIDTPGAKAEAALLLKQIDRASAERRLYTVPGVGLVDPTGRVIKPSAPTPTDLQRNYEFAKTPEGGGFKGSLADFKVLSTPRTTVTNVSEKAEQGERGKMLVQDFKAISQQAANAQKNLPSIDANLNILNKGFETGFGTDAVAAGAKVLGALGVKGAENFATNAQVFLANANEAVLQKQIEQKGTQTKADADRIEQTGAKLGNTKDGNRFILTVAKEQLNRDIEQRKFYADWYKRNKTYDGAEDAWFDGPGNKSLFDRPALKVYGASAAAQIPTAATPARAAPAAAPANVITNPQFPGFSIRKP